MASDIAEWRPPTEAEEKVLRAKRDRDNKVSKLMADYLLKGWKMLSSYCEECGTILLQDKQGRKYCIPCTELTSDTDKDNPAMSAEAAESQAREHQRCQTSTIVSTNGLLSCGDSSDEFSVQQVQSSASAPGTRRELPSTCSERPKAVGSQRLEGGRLPPLEGSLVQNGACSSSQPVRNTVKAGDMSINTDDTQDVLIQKLDWATNQLKFANSIENCTQLCKLITAAAEALNAVRQTNAYMYM